jgi:hypothetical protein
MTIQRLDHVGVVVDDLEATMEPCSRGDGAYVHGVSTHKVDDLVPALGAASSPA